MEKDLISDRIGKRLRHYRQQLNLTLDDLAELTGVSKPMLGQIERGSSNPTVATLWKIASGLQVPLTAFIFENPSLKVVRAEEQPQFREDNKRFEAYNTYAAPGVSLETFRARLLPGCSYQSEPHGLGVIESITVFEGTLTIEIGPETSTLSKGDAISFSAETGHIYQNNTDEICEIAVSILYSNVSSPKSSI
ncbi:XRE family transcriptional regulator [Paenibacillus thiaminolyticus]|uniref:helix-turn-helix domain-containing protein n=1 Tax=Paenibacillus thiaminolyticus TaxID=49283 RepID=UPI0023311AE2|nr:XRE family transcriptional regulator [Paenibacillus thiaminolyticus]WCF05785.1 XRE family transcriptional regulator [Paenibacillus thiaminolyticus]WII35148.1 XRE family transcriptional regulator [Paenibacillus thiaminolyticus]